MNSLRTEGETSELQQSCHDSDKNNRGYEGRKGKMDFRCGIWE